MMILISGENGSGKSLFAEKLAAASKLPRYYLATMVAQSEENEKRIAKHRLQRKDLNFTTVEEPCYVSGISVPADSLVLLEDASNLLGNMLFSIRGTREDALREILQLRDACEQLLVVTISGLSAEGYDGETEAYIRDLQWLNEQLYAQADGAVELRHGVSVWRKGSYCENT